MSEEKKVINNFLFEEVRKGDKVLVRLKDGSLLEGIAVAYTEKKFFKGWKLSTKKYQEVLICFPNNIISINV